MRFAEVVRWEEKRHAVRSVSDSMAENDRPEFLVELPAAILIASGSKGFPPGRKSQLFRSAPLPTIRGKMGRGAGQVKVCSQEDHFRAGSGPRRVGTLLPPFSIALAERVLFIG